MIVMPEMRRRLPGIEKTIDSIEPENDVRVRLTGTVIDISGNALVIDDGTGKTEIIFEDQPNTNTGQMVRVVTRILPLIDGFQCRGEALQNMQGFDTDLYKRVKEIVKRWYNVQSNYR